MPFINTKTTAFIDQETKDALTADLCAIAQECLGKGEAWVMCGFEPEASLAFRGDVDKVCYVEVKAFGRLSPAATDNMTAEVCQLMEAQLGIPQDRCYVAYFPVDNWGWNGGNF